MENEVFFDSFLFAEELLILKNPEFYNWHANFLKDSHRISTNKISVLDKVADFFCIYRLFVLNKNKRKNKNRQKIKTPQCDL